MRPEELDPYEEEVLLDALDALDGGTAPDLGDREVLELWGVLAGALEPVPPRPGSRERLLARLALAEAGPLPVPLDLPHSEARWGASRLALAASVLVALALGVFSIATWGENRRLGQRVVALERNLDRETRSREAAEIELAGARDRLGLVTAINTEICPLRPPADAPPSSARGVLWIAADHQHWHLTVEGLAADEGAVFELWFLVGDSLTALSAGTFEARAGERVELGSPQMPTGTRAVAITLESAGDPARSSAAGPTVLFGDEILRMI